MYKKLIYILLFITITHYTYSGNVVYDVKRIVRMRNNTISFITVDKVNVTINGDYLIVEGK